MLAHVGLYTGGKEGCNPLPLGRGKSHFGLRAEQQYEYWVFLVSHGRVLDSGPHGDSIILQGDFIEKHGDREEWTATRLNSEPEWCFIIGHLCKSQIIHNEHYVRA